MKRRKGTIASYPYQDYLIYKVYHKEQGRWYAILYPKEPNDGVKRTSISYAKYVMSVHLGRLLDQNETVDHIDEDKTNDSIENLQLMSQVDNTRKSMEKKHPKVVVFCKVCGSKVERTKRSVLTNTGPIYCSRKCYETTLIGDSELGKRLSKYPNKRRTGQGVSPEERKKISDSMKLYWAMKKGTK